MRLLHASKAKPSAQKVKHTPLLVPVRGTSQREGKEREREREGKRGERKRERETEREERKREREERGERIERETERDREREERETERKKERKIKGGVAHLLVELLDDQVRPVCVCMCVCARNFCVSWM